MRVYYINLEKNKENRDEMKRLFPSAERLEGVDGTKLNVQDIYPFCVDKIGETHTGIDDLQKEK